METNYPKPWTVAPYGNRWQIQSAEIAPGLAKMVGHVATQAEADRIAADANNKPNVEATDARWLVIDWDGSKEVGVNENGTHCETEDAPLMSMAEADALAAKHDAQSIHEDALFGDDDEEG